MNNFKNIEYKRFESKDDHISLNIDEPLDGTRYPFR